MFTLNGTLMSTLYIAAHAKKNLSNYSESTWPEQGLIVIKYDIQLLSTVHAITTMYIVVTIFAKS